MWYFPLVMLHLITVHMTVWGVRCLVLNVVILFSIISIRLDNVYALDDLWIGSDAEHGFYCYI